jgi:hypothetical protein
MNALGLRGLIGSPMWLKGWHIRVVGCVRGSLIFGGAFGGMVTQWFLAVVGF